MLASSLGIRCSAPKSKMNRGVTITDRYQAILNINRVVLAKSSIDQVFQALCKVLRQLMVFQRAGLTVYDREHDGLRIQALFGPHKNSVFHIGYLLARDSSQSGWVLVHKTPAIRGDLSKEFIFPSEEQLFYEGYRSMCSVPLIIRGSGVGAVTVVGTEKNQFSLIQARLLREMSDQISLAVAWMLCSCTVHPQTRLMCPRCIGAAGGKTTVLRHREALSSWGKQGGRGHKKPNS
jgi:transcriptional regulator with GAF, ATPase, and Fis domain